MVRFIADILKFGRQGEKTGWTYIEVPARIAGKLMPGQRKSFRVKGTLDRHRIEKAALLPMGDGSFILPLNAAMRKGTGKRHGGRLQVVIEADKEPIPLNSDLLECLSDEPAAMEFFNTLPPSQRSYFSKWVESAKTPPTQAKRIAQAIVALTRKWDFVKMMRAKKTDKR